MMTIEQDLRTQIEDLESDTSSLAQQLEEALQRLEEAEDDIKMQRIWMDDAAKQLEIVTRYSRDCPACDERIDFENLDSLPFEDVIAEHGDDCDIIDLLTHMPPERR